jgi:hypothetical protein
VPVLELHPVTLFLKTRPGLRFNPRAHGTFRVPVLELHPVTLFLKTRPGLRFNPRAVRFRDTVQDGRSNTATVDVKAARSGSRIVSIRFAGHGGAYRTHQPVGPSPSVVANGHGLSPEAVDVVLEEHPMIRRETRHDVTSWGVKSRSETLTRR